MYLYGKLITSAHTLSFEPMLHSGHYSFLDILPQKSIVAISRDRLVLFSPVYFISGIEVTFRFNTSQQTTIPVNVRVSQHIAPKCFNPLQMEKVFVNYKALPLYWVKGKQTVDLYGLNTYLIEDAVHLNHVHTISYISPLCPFVSHNWLRLPWKRHTTFSNNPISSQHVFFHVWGKILFADAFNLYSGHAGSEQKQPSVNGQDISEIIGCHKPDIIFSMVVIIKNVQKICVHPGKSKWAT